MSRLTRFGEGSIIGAKVARRIHPTLAAELSETMQVIVVSGTNGKTTTTRMIADALAPTRSVATNRTGANLTDGALGALLRAPDAECAVLEIDEAVLGWALSTLSPDLVVLLNLSRDQLDRLHEVPSIAHRWRRAIIANPPRTIVANADDPLVVYATAGRPTVWVAAGLTWTSDASICLDCGGIVEFPASGWVCRGCGRSRPRCSASLVGDVVRIDDEQIDLALSLPGRSVQANAAMALTAVSQLGVTVIDAIRELRELTNIEGRAQWSVYCGTEVRLHLAKNPAGWRDTLEMIGGDASPVVLALNARSQDGRDPSWLWDVELGQLRGRSVVCMGERVTDLAVRLAYAEVPCEMAMSLRDATGIVGPGPVHVIANYSAFQQIRATISRAR